MSKLNFPAGPYYLSIKLDKHLSLPCQEHTELEICEDIREWVCEDCGLEVHLNDWEPPDRSTYGDG